MLSGHDVKVSSNFQLINMHNDISAISGMKSRLGLSTFYKQLQARINITSLAISDILSNF